MRSFRISLESISFILSFPSFMLFHQNHHNLIINKIFFQAEGPPPAYKEGEVSRKHQTEVVVVM